MSALSTLASIQTGTIKKEFPDPDQLIISRLYQVADTTVFNGTGNATQTDAIGIRSLTLTPYNYPLRVCFGAPNGYVAKTWLQTDVSASDVTGVQFIEIPAGHTQTFYFNSPLTVWHMASVGVVTDVEQRIQR